jgi:hypothetical protein
VADVGHVGGRVPCAYRARVPAHGRHVAGVGRVVHVAGVGGRMCYAVGWALSVWQVLDSRQALGALGRNLGARWALAT